MGSKDHLVWPKHESDLQQVSPGRQLRSRLVQLCPICNQPTQNKVGQQNVCNCSLSSTPISSNEPILLANQPKKKNRKIMLPTTACKRQLFDATTSHETPENSVTSSDVQKSTDQKCIESGEGQSSSSVQSPLPTFGQMLRGRHVCQLCFKSFTSPCKLTQHSYSHTGEKPFVCKHCSKAFSSKFKLVRHVLIHSDQRQYHCNICDRTFHRKDHLKNHAKVHNPIKRTLQCDRPGCSKEYSSVLSYRKHIAVHSVEEGFLDCKICNKVFESKDELLYHLKIHSGSRVIKTPADKKYRCNFCDRCFYTGKDVRRHLVVHTGLRDFLCQYCPQRFGRKDHLTRHIKKSHNINTLKKSKPKKSNDQYKCKSVETVYLETYGQQYKLERKISETVTSGSLIKQENLTSEIPMFHSSEITSFNYGENSSVIQTIVSHGENPSLNYTSQSSYPVDELKEFNTNLTNQLPNAYQETNSTDIPGLTHLIDIIPQQSLDSESSLLSEHESSVIIQQQPAHHVTIEQSQIGVSEYLTSSSDILTALLRESSETGTTTLPGFSQVFHQQQ
ncbi:zinc finger protein PLAG1-like [Daktulosphaira vitifoliae]|uniref:zinc finger protein PLAG1-like n=1 Tax=Daktulosphaira vitifoliae TaxID=58002 RepID=UPI0021AADAFC|nr:zinc finger protein PLAG1-like [Daktulosphaira vitifoliae]